MSDENGNGNGRIHLLGDHKPPKPSKAEQQREQTVQMIEHYMVQIPDLVARAIEGALVAYDKGRRDEFKAWVGGQEYPSVYDGLLSVFGPRAPMPSQPEQES